MSHLSRLVLKGRKRETARGYPDTLDRAYSMVKSEKSEKSRYICLHDELLKGLWFFQEYDKAPPWRLISLRLTYNNHQSANLNFSINPFICKPIFLGRAWTWYNSFVADGNHALQVSRAELPAEPDWYTWSCWLFLSGEPQYQSMRRGTTACWCHQGYISVDTFKLL